VLRACRLNSETLRDSAQFASKNGTDWTSKVRCRAAPGTQRLIFRWYLVTPAAFVPLSNLIHPSCHNFNPFGSFDCCLLPFAFGARRLSHTPPNEEQEVPYLNIMTTLVQQRLDDDDDDGRHHHYHHRVRIDEDDDDDSMIDGWMIDRWMTMKTPPFSPTQPTVPPSKARPY
jgi:hypothetical protein